MQPHQERVVLEKHELDIKLDKLGEFLHGKLYPTLSEDERARLTKQYSLMRDYSNILGERISAF